MQSINALSVTPEVNDWLSNSRHPRILHVFDHACNLTNERRDVLSVVSRQIGNGPFNLVIEDEVLFSDHLNAQSPVSINAGQLHFGDLAITITKADLWSPRPNWEMLHANKDNILNSLINYEIASGSLSTQNPSMTRAFTNYQLPILQSLISSLGNVDLPSSLAAAQKLAGLGVGLTPTGDDFILGAVLAAWIIHPPEIARVLAGEITNTAAPLTTSLSAAWLRSAGRGGAGVLWHDFFDALISEDAVTMQESIKKIMSVGHTSGEDAFAGFIGTLVCYAVEACTQHG